ncbi:right-handed parallel beta-helix repeat-containing protein [Paraglaciecola aquimarina]|uniref:Right-handed parallel beta-helix repeat-containing protein n=1 Tax=Paraglaciecola aquimarina TaxID=1235557 RepID=A0ABU3T2J3_9ALTE|nr:right-handed parallel beta-helix repeat-containing protein [Paraglaciecola aquimarina]MDU0356427.1 right-handed parallel beta-helix repeat-containing protein [Paraglaciecola aquimarina]
MHITNSKFVKKHMTTLGLGLALLLAAQQVIAGTIIDVSQYGVTKNDGSDSTYQIRKILEMAKQQGATKIVFPKGKYDFYPDRAMQKNVYISNNDPGVKRIIFPLDGFENLEIDGQGSDFMFHGGVNPFVLEDGKNIKFSHFSVDFKRSFHSEASVLATGDGYLDIHIPEAFPYKINTAGILTFVGLQDSPPGKILIPKLERRIAVDNASDYQFKRLLEFDAKLRETAYMRKDIQTGNGLPAEKLPGDRNVRIFQKDLVATVGNIMTFQAKYRKYPGFVVSDSSDVVLDNITIHHAGGMGLLAQRSHNVTMQNSKVTPSEGRYVSTTADATHFVNCTGKIQLLNNLFENQKDDATNIHGIYVAVDKILDAKTIDVRLQHPQQYGFDFIDAGDTLELVHAPSMNTYSTAKVASSERISEEITRVVFQDKFDSRLQEGDSIAEVRDYAEVLIKGNTIRRNRARGMLLNSRGKTVVEDNYFHAPGSAILFEGDANFWYEQGGVSQAIIRNNVFDNSFYAQWGTGIIAVAAGIDNKYKESSRYNKNILIENNTFKVFDYAPILNLFSVDGLVFKNNVIEKNSAYPARAKYKHLFVVNHSDAVSIEKDNTFVGFEKSKEELTKFSTSL